MVGVEAEAKTFLSNTSIFDLSKELPDCLIIDVVTPLRPCSLRTNSYFESVQSFSQINFEVLHASMGCTAYSWILD